MADKIKFKPIGQYILVKPEEAEKTTKSGVVLVEKDPERPQKGTVVELGSGVLLPNGEMIPFALKVGDKVYFKKYGGTEIELDNEKYLVMTEGEILGIVTE